MSGNVINVGLYGGKSIFGGRETPLEASVISCDMCKECSFYQNNQCLAVRSVAGTGCKFGRVETKKGYTSRARKYWAFKDKWRSHEMYNKLQHPPEKLGKIGEYVVFPYPYVYIETEESGEVKVENPTFGRQKFYIPTKAFTVDFIYQVCKFRPQAMMGGEIREHQKETVPLFLAHLEEVFPALFEKFVATYAEYNVKPEYVGRKVLLKTLQPSYVEYKSRDYPKFNEKWYWDGELLTYDSGYLKLGASVTKDYEVVVLKIRPADGAVVTVSDNDQVTKDTVFVD
ncbi:hypothetical protein CN495_08585 [Bacillus thuringiensis]|uniref:Uncharacterized protein n=1 Tax=Bacillus thuringiensis TaxID=1428 RepID=A0ABD6SCZ6_BACTU|nr:hypothetical protein [Bacillus thuringiensis]PER55797.1 hypothetical protein CN495_08585 [Bacillus thuringiensis]